MTTINGVTFNMRNLRPVAVHRNSVSEQPGSDTNFITDMGYDGLVLRLEGYEESLATYDSVISEFMKSGEQTLVHRTGWQFKVYSVQLTPELIEGIVDNYFPYDLILYTSTPYRESTTETTRSKTITTNNQEWSADDSANDIDTGGSVDAVPDIQVIGGSTHASISQKDDDSNYNINNSTSTVTITQANQDGTANFTSSNTHGQTINCRKAGMAIIDSFQIDVSSVTQSGNVTCTVRDSVGGTSLGSKTDTISSTGVHTFTFATPIAVVQNENSCADSTDSNKIYFDLAAIGSTDLGLYKELSGSYADGARYLDDSPLSSDFKFVVSGHSCKEIRQTFEVTETTTISTVVLELCKYQYAGSNAITVVIKDGATTLGTGTAVLSGSTFAEVEFYLEEETANSLELSFGTTYTIIITPPSDSVNNTVVLIKTDTTAGYTGGVVTLVEDGGTTRAQTHDLYFKLYFIHSNEDVNIYNTDDTTVKCNVANKILESAIYRINADGTGSIDYDDDFSTTKWERNSINSGVTHDTGNDELDIADDGYIYWHIDTKYPITGIPTLTSRINITVGTPTIQISSDASTWYDITTAIVDDVETIYELNSSSLSLKGSTFFYYRYDCVKAGVATASIKSFELDINIVTIDAEHPKITAGGAVSTFRCDQDAASGMNCTVSFVFRDRSWPA